MNREGAEGSVQRIAQNALHVRELGLTDAAIARRLGVSDKTIAKAIRWLRETARGPGRGETGS